MANIGIFTAQNGSFTGTVRTLTLNVKVKFVPNTKESDNAPDYRIVAGNFEIGAAWKKISKAERPYLSATLGGLACCSLHLIAAFSPSRSARALPAGILRPSLNPDGCAAPCLSRSRAIPPGILPRRRP